MIAVMTGTLAIRARYVFPIDRPPIADGVVHVADGRITAVGTYCEAVAKSALVDLGNAALLPGLVNAHTHLEFSHRRQPLGVPGMPLPQWIRELVAHRREMAGDVTAAVAVGLDESLKHGITALGEIATPGWSAEAIGGSPLDVTAFFELIGLAADRVDPKLRELRAFFAGHARHATWRAGISPHAPYSVHPELWSSAVEEARRVDAPVAFHLAESREELQLLRDGTGPFRDLLIDLGAWDETAIPRGARPLDYLQKLMRAPRALVIHGNYLDDDEIALLAAHRETMSLVYCPRTHAYFEHAPYPLAHLLQSGVSVALGTDSRASNPDLSLLAEMRLVARGGEVPPSAIMQLGTLDGAKALGLDSQLGSLTPGKSADLCAVALADADADPHELLLENDTPVMGVWRKGRRLWPGPPQ
jgi:cytosine/adenosine deaminase-related metal-dependent hydrolase